MPYTLLEILNADNPRRSDGSPSIVPPLSSRTTVLPPLQAQQGHTPIPQIYDLPGGDPLRINTHSVFAVPTQNLVSPPNTVVVAGYFRNDRSGSSDPLVTSLPRVYRGALIYTDRSGYSPILDNGEATLSPYGYSTHTYRDTGVYYEDGDPRPRLGRYTYQVRMRVPPIVPVSVSDRPSARNIVGLSLKSVEGYVSLLPTSPRFMNIEVQDHVASHAGRAAVVTYNDNDSDDQAYIDLRPRDDPRPAPAPVPDRSAYSTAYSTGSDRGLPLYPSAAYYVRNLLQPRGDFPDRATSVQARSSTAIPDQPAPVPDQQDASSCVQD